MVARLYASGRGFLSATSPRKRFRPRLRSCVQWGVAGGFGAVGAQPYEALEGLMEQVGSPNDTADGPPVQLASSSTRLFPFHFVPQGVERFEARGFDPDAPLDRELLEPLEATLELCVRPAQGGRGVGPR